MIDMRTAGPGSVLSSTDPGDDTQRRFRYQAAYSAILSLELLKGEPDCEFQEIFCEHHEDTLVHRTDGKFIGVQVKTRQQGRELFKANDGQIVGALRRFLELYIEHPGYFSRFVIATNYAFWKERDTSESLPHLINLSRDSNNGTNGGRTRVLSVYLKQIASQAKNPTVDESRLRSMLEVLQITELQDDLPKFDDVESRIAGLLPEFFDCGTACMDDLIRAARALINRMLEAASLSYISPRQLYFATCQNPDARRTESAIDGKRIRRNDIADILTRAFGMQPTILLYKPWMVNDLPPGIRLLERKLTAGRISAANVRRAKDHKYSMEYLLQTWAIKYGNEVAQKRFNQIAAIVATECQEAFDESQKEGIAFGQAMLDDVRRRLRQRLQNEVTSFFGSSYEHLLGTVGILTEICEVWWSEEFQIGEYIQ